MTYISRDSFARTELHRVAIETSQSCQFCGNRRKGGKLFQYQTHSDGGRVSIAPKLFCSISCMRSYHG